MAKATSYLQQLLDQFLNETSWTKSQRLIEDHPDLLSAETDALLNKMLNHQQQEHNTENAALLTRCRTLFRHCREMGINAAFQQMKQQAEQATQLLHIIDQFIHAETWDEKRHLVQKYPELLSAEVDAQMGQLTNAQEDENARTAVEAHRYLLGRCRELGDDLAKPADLTDMPQRVDQCRQALSIITRSDQPQRWAAIHVELADSLAQNPLGERANNLEEAIVNYQAALCVYTQDNFPEHWAMTHNNLGLAYWKRLVGKPAENIEQTISHYQQALEVYTTQIFPEQWAMTQNNLGLAFMDRILGDRAENLEQAIKHCQQALEVCTRQIFPTNWAMTHNNLGLAYWKRIVGERAENMEQAISHYQQALEVYTRQTFLEQWAMTQNNLGLVYWKRILGDRAENLERAINHYQQALEVYTRQAFPTDWAQTQNNLGAAYSSNRILEKRAENLEQSIGHYKQALEIYTRQAYPNQWAQIQYNLGNAYAQRILGNRTDNLEEAIEFYQHALEIRTITTNPFEHRQTQWNLGHLCLDLQRWNMAIQAFRGALDANDLIYTADATPEARRFELQEVKGVPANLAYALARQAKPEQTLLREAIVVLERNRARWLAEGLALNAEKPAAVPKPLWQQFTQTAEQIRQLQAKSQLLDNRQNALDYLTLSPLLSNTYHKLTAIVQQVRQHDPSFMPEPNFSDIQVALTAVSNVKGHENGAAGIYFLTTSLGSLALIVHPAGVTPVWLPLTEAALNDMLLGWRNIYANRNKDAKAWNSWLDTIATTTHLLWEQMMGPVSMALHELLPSSRSSAPPIVLIPLGLLSLLPLHAAWTEDTKQPTGRRYFLDEFTVSYTPSALALRHARAEAVAQPNQHILAIDEPKPVQAPPLPSAKLEVDAIAALFATPVVLRHEQATVNAVRQALPPADIVHFCCHGANNWGNPLESGLCMAQGKLLTVRDLLGLEDAAGRLVTLSACETGIVGTDLPDEVVMLPSALLQAGFGGVVSSLWSVNDLSTAMLMVRFYEYWQNEGLAPAQALRAAQCWLRDTTSRAKREYFKQFSPGFSGVQLAGRHMPEAVALTFFTQINSPNLDQMDFAHPFWWAAFYLTGV